MVSELQQPRNRNTLALGRMFNSNLLVQLFKITVDIAS